MSSARSGRRVIGPPMSMMSPSLTSGLGSSNRGHHGSQQDDVIVNRNVFLWTSPVRPGPGRDARYTAAA